MRLELGRGRMAMAGGLVGLALLASACELVGQGDLHVANDQSGLASGALFRAFEHEAGDVYPPAGFLGVGVIGDDFGQPPAFGMDGFLYLVSADDPCPQSEGAPEVYDPDDVTVQGVVTVTDGGVKQMVTVPDTSVNRDPYWALIDISEFPGTGGGHLIRRCGEVTWS